MQEQRPMIGVGVIVRRGDTILLQRRMNAHGEGTWSLPGGHLEWNESLEDCAAREVREEVGLVVRHSRFVGLTNDRMYDDDRHYLTVFMEAACEGEPSIREPQKSSALGWFSVEAFPAPLFEPLRALMHGEAYGSTLL